MGRSYLLVAPHVISDMDVSRIIRDVTGTGPELSGPDDMVVRHGAGSSVRIRRRAGSDFAPDVIQRWEKALRPGALGDIWEVSYPAAAAPLGDQLTPRLYVTLVKDRSGGFLCGPDSTEIRFRKSKPLWRSLLGRLLPG